jgi:hypothetical protein
MWCSGWSTTFIIEGAFGGDARPERISRRLKKRRQKSGDKFPPRVRYIFHFFYNYWASYFVIVFG